MDTLKTLLKFHMERKGFNPTSLSKKANLNVTAVRDILEHNAEPYPRIDTFAKLCRALDVRPHQLSPLFRELYPHEQDPFDDIHQPDENEKDAARLHAVTPELLASLNDWCNKKKSAKAAQASR